METVRRQVEKRTIPNRKAIPVKLANVLDGLPNKSFLMCPIQVSLSTVALNRFAERAEQQLPGEGTPTGNVTDHKHMPETNDIGQLTESFELDGDTDDLNCADVEIGDAKSMTNAVSPTPIPVSLQQPVIRDACEKPLKIGVNGCVETGNVDVSKKKKHRKAKTMCCLQRQYLDLRLPKLQPQPRITQSIDAKQLSKQLKRKRNLPRIANLRNAAGNVSFVYLTPQESSNIEFRLAKNSKTKTHNV